MTPDRYRTLGGTSVVAASTVTVLGFVTAASLYPGYSTSTQTISALGAAGATPGSRAVFNGAMVVGGGLLLLAAYGLHRAYGRRLLTGLVAVTGAVGFAGVGLFPAQTGFPHFVAAMVAFVGAGATALAVAATARGPFRYVSAAFGLLELGALALFVALGGATPLGIGGLERWVAFLGLLWAASLGGLLTAADPGLE